MDFQTHADIMHSSAVWNSGFVSCQVNHAFYSVTESLNHIGVAPLIAVTHSMPPAPSPVGISNAYPNRTATTKGNIRPHRTGHCEFHEHK